MRQEARLTLAPILLVLSLLLGGASAAGFVSNLVLQLAGLAMIVWVLSSDRTTHSTSARQIYALMVLALLLVCIQILPLPPGIWSHLGGRMEVVEGYKLMNQPLPWLSISLSPQQTIASAVWLIPAVAIFLLIAKQGAFRASWIAWAMAFVAMISVAVGALQLGSGAGSSWYFYKVTTVGAAVGFFANANHEATLLFSTIPFLAALYLNSTRKESSAARSSGLFVVLAGILAVLIVGIAINGSLAGIGLAGPVSGATAVMLAWRKRKVPAWLLGLFVVISLTSIFLAFSTPFGNNLTSVESKFTPGSRQVTFRNSLDAAMEYAPLGSGIGTFPRVYPKYEKLEEVDRFYVNHVHNDYIELALEAGLPALILILLFLAWWVRRLFKVWTDDKPDSFARAASIASGAILAHSMVDYPLRTAAISVLFAACCALMADPRARSRRVAEPEQSSVRHLSAD